MYIYITSYMYICIHIYMWYSTNIVLFLPGKSEVCQGHAVFESILLYDSDVSKIAIHEWITSKLEVVSGILYRIFWALPAEEHGLYFTVIESTISDVRDRSVWNTYPLKDKDYLTKPISWQGFSVLFLPYPHEDRRNNNN